MSGTPATPPRQDGFVVDYDEHLLHLDEGTVHVYEWRPCGAAIACIHISHGAGEHARRYQQLARTLTAAGYAVVAHDHLGHGRTGQEGGSIGDLGEAGMRGAIRVTSRVIDWAKDRYRGLKFVELGHSWGSLIGQKLLRQCPERFDAVVWSGTTLMLPLAANTGNFNAPWAGDDTGLSWLTRDGEIVRAAMSDRLTFDFAAAKLLNLPGLLGTFSLPRVGVRGRARRVPVYIIAGSHDTVSRGGRGARALAWWYRRLTGLRDVTCVLYPEARHEVFNETNRGVITAALLDWLHWQLVAPETNLGGTDAR